MGLLPLPSRRRVGTIAAAMLKMVAAAIRVQLWYDLGYTSAARSVFTGQISERTSSMNASYPCMSSVAIALQCARDLCVQQWQIKADCVRRGVG